MIKDAYQTLRIDVGRDSGGKYVRVTHHPTAIVLEKRLQPGLIPAREIQSLIRELESKLRDDGLDGYLEP